MTDYDTLLLLAQKIAELKKEVSSLQTKTETVAKLEGPQGLQGPKGDKGDPGRNGSDHTCGDGRQAPAPANAEPDAALDFYGERGGHR